MGFNLRWIEFLLGLLISLQKKIMEREEKNPQYFFLMNSGCPENIYYRWKIFSLLQPGDTETCWRTAAFQMVLGGPVWIPPPCTVQPVQIIPAKEKEKEKEKEVKIQRPVERERERDTLKERRNHADPEPKRLPDILRDEFEDMLRDLTMERQRIKEAMGFALDHADLSTDVS
jgi:hypothetical protein